MPEVLTRSWNGENEREFANLARGILLPVVRSDIIIDVPHKDMVPLVEDGRFRIHIWSSCQEKNDGRRPERAPEKIYGIEVACTDNSFRPCGQPGESYVFRCPDSNYAVAELFGNNLFIHHDLCHSGSESERRIFKRLLTEVAQALQSLASSEMTAERLAEELDRARVNLKKTLAAFVDFCCAACRAEIAQATETVNQNVKRIKTLREAATKLLEKRAEAEEKLEASASVEKSSLDSFGVEFDKLLTVPGVLGVEIKNNVLSVYTRMIRIVEGGVTYRIGRFRIDIRMFIEDADSGLRFFNLTNDGKGPGWEKPPGFPSYPASDFNRHHPHVRADGQACLGNLKEAIPQYIAARQYSVVAILALQFLQTVNTEDQAGKGIGWWPKDDLLDRKTQAVIKERREETDESF